MSSREYSEDIRQIRGIIARQFESSSWTCDRPARWDMFAADFLPGAALHPAARAADSQTVEDFVARMRTLAGTTLHSFEQAVLGSEVLVFRNVAIAVAICEMTENAADANRGVEMLLLVKTEGQWRVASQAWDKASVSHSIPARWLAGDGSI